MAIDDSGSGGSGGKSPSTGGPAISPVAPLIPIISPMIGGGESDTSSDETTSPIAQLPFMGPLTKILTMLSDPAFWKRFGIALLGILLIITGMVIVFRRPIASGAKEVINLVGPGGKMKAASKAMGAMNG